MHWITAHLRAHALLFEPAPRPAYSSAAGLRLLAIFVLFEGILGPRFALLTLLGVPDLATWVRIPLQISAALLLVRFVAGVRFAEIGLSGWRHWSESEKSYIRQIVPLALAIFTVISIGRLRELARIGLTGDAALTLAAYFIWGFYQELMYRGILQAELVRRWGRAPGILVSNSLYAFGPLHFYYWTAHNLRTAVVMFALVFAIGVFFGLLFHRSRNLWLPATLHGIGDVYLTALPRLRP